MKTAHLSKRYRAAQPQLRAQVNPTTGPVATEDCWMTPREAAEYLRLGYKRLLNMSSSGQIPYHKLGRSNRYLKSELFQLLQSQRKGPQI